MSERDNGGPAFPSSYWATPESDQPTFRGGMYLRDWFAGQAIAGILVTEHDIVGPGIAKAAYALADAMLEQRKK